ncbi:DUF6204 family protein [Brevibacterium renqingii]|uniref:DUF6204 family protein n=1 Tax=Brevibacterium renqingii TaxID=2776916 RepID=UPI001ADFE47C|nr:DUF6204 family protein [Brevibacterium renqingii]
MTWNFRITVRGRFTGLDAEQRRSLRAAQDEHDMLSARFSPEGTFLYTPELVNYQHRFLITSDEADRDDAETLASIRAEELSAADLASRGLGGRTMNVSAVCVEEVKVRPRTRS